MQKNLVKASPDDSILDAYRLMCSKNIRHLPVFHQESLVGLISDRDFHRAMVVDRPGELNLEIFLNSEKKVKDFMSWPIFTVMDFFSLRSVTEEMIKRKISAVLVQNDQLQYVGIITTEDILSEFLKLLDKEAEMRDSPLSFFISNTLY